MRPKFVLVLMLGGLMAAAIAFIFRPHNAEPSTVVEVSQPPTAVTQAAPSLPPPLPLPAPTAPAPHVLTDEERQDAIQAEIVRLQDWEVNDDPQSLSNILADLTNPEKTIREAAIEASKQFGSTNAIPALKAAALNSTNTEEQIAMLEAANFLSLTPISDSSVQLPLTSAQIQADQLHNAQDEAKRTQDLARQQARVHGQQPNVSPSPSPAPSPTVGN